MKPVILVAEDDVAVCGLLHSHKMKAVGLLTAGWRMISITCSTLESETQTPTWSAWIDVSQRENAIIHLVIYARDAMEGQSGVIKTRTRNQRITRSGGRGRGIRGW